MKCPKCGSTLAEGVKFCSECGSRVSTVSSASEPLSGDRVEYSGLTKQGAGEAAERGLPNRELGDRYELGEEVGRGGFAVVFRARDRDLDRPVAVKRLLPKKDFRSLERFEREANLIAGLNHRNIVQVYDCGKDAEGPWIVMEWVGGGTLKALLKERDKLPVAEAKALMRGLCRGLAHAHRKNLVHRDIKPANILLERDGEEVVPKIVDFGLARVGMDNEASETGYGMGTPYYMPPEQRRDAKSVNHTADIYALGKTFYEMLTGELPDQVDLEKLPPELGCIAARCCKTRPEERYFSVEDLLRDIEEPKGETKAASQRSAAGESACPQCQAPNAEDVKFCGVCGAGLTRPCPECARENPVRRKYCGGCGTEVEGFGGVKEILARMEQFSTEKKWSSVLKEAGLIKKEWRLPGKKGRQMLAKLEGLSRAASGAAAEIKRLSEALETAVRAEEWGAGVAACEALKSLGPEAGEHGDRMAELTRRWDEGDWDATCARVESLGREGKLTEAAACWQAYVKAHPQGAHVAEARRAEDDWAWAATEAELARCEAGGEHVGAAKALLGYLKGGYMGKRGMAREGLVSQVVSMANSDEPGLLEYLPELEGLELSDPDQGRLRSAVQGWKNRIIQRATAENPFVNSLGMKFVPAGTDGVLFSVWQTRVRDYEAFVKDGGPRSDKPLFAQKATHPAVMVSWDDAKAFCAWLTEKERAEGRITSDQQYRLPTDAEWSVAVGLEKERGGTPADKDGKIEGVYPWGTQWPPPKGAGNYDPSLKVDDFERTSPVGSFAANRYGLFDMGGNVWEWCEDFYDGSSGYRVLRGASWGDVSPDFLLSSSRDNYDPDLRLGNNGFRCVLATQR